MDSFWIYPILFLTGLSAGFVDSIAGGGGLITVPVLLSLGLSPVEALGTNKLQACFGSGSATWQYGRAGLICWKDCRHGVLFTAIGAIAGTLLVQRVHPELLRQAIPVLLIGIAVYLLFRPAVGAVSTPGRVEPGAFHFWGGLALGFYDGFFGPGTGSFWAIAYVLLLGYDLTRATAHTKVMNLTSNIGSLLIFLIGNQVLFGAGIVMGAGQLLGARLGSRAVIKKGGRLIRPIFIGVVILISLKLLYQGLRTQSFSPH
jgi:uncharacterized membrane protein YfcA